MAGSYYHIVDEKGNFVDNDTFSDMIENLGDAYEMTEEMYGMIWWLATRGSDDEFAKMNAVQLVEKAHQNYELGLGIAKITLDKPSR